ncbi:MAG: thioredoxin domain-containing protein [Candidatus Saccharibacteria bacterium]
MSREAKILTAILVVVVGGMIGLFIAFGGGGTPATKVTDAGKLTRSASHTQGSGKVQIVEFGDYQCPSCGAAYPIIKQLQSENANDISLIFRNFPLPQLHANALTAAEAAEAAGKQGKYFEMHDKLYETQKDWSTLSNPLDTFVSYAKDLGLDQDKFKQDIEAENYKAIIDTDVADGNALGVNATPTFYINGKKMDSFDYPTLRDAIAAAKAAK